MATVKIYLPHLSGYITGPNTLTLKLTKTSDASAVNEAGDTLTESGTSGWFSATVAETWAEALGAAVVDQDGLVPAFGWLGVGSDIVADGDVVLNTVTQTQLNDIESAIVELRSLEVVFEGTVTSAGAAAIQFTTSGYAENQLRDMLVVFETGDGAGESSPIKTNRIINGSLDEIEFAETLVITPSVGSTFTVRATHIHSVASIQSGLATQTSVDDLPTNTELATALGAADDVVLSTLSTLQTSINNIDDFVDTEVAAIKAKTDLLVTFPTNFSSLGINASGHISRVVLVDTTTANTDLVSAATIATTILTTQMAESYSADGVAPTLSQALFLIQQAFTEFVITGTGISVKKLDGVTEAAGYTMDSATTPTQRLRTS